MPDRSAGVQQGRLYYSEREMLTRARAGEHVAPADVVKLLERLARYRGPVSHEPQERWHIRLADEVELRNAVVEGPLGPLLGGGCEVVRAEPREEEQEPPDWNIEGMTEPEAGSPSVASVLRRTASRLRDPEYHWYEHPAVTLEHLAEKLEKDDSLAEARGLASLDEAELSLLRAVIYGEGDGFTDDEVTRWRRVMQKIGFDPDGPNGF